MSNRPEHYGPPETFYNDDEAKKYTNNSRIIGIQNEMCERAMELLLLPENKKCLLLDIGCGSGLSGNVIENCGHHWIGTDISTSMLMIAVDRKVKGDLALSDMGQGLPFKAATFDGAISISALQWLCNVDKNMYAFQKRLISFFNSLYATLCNNARAVFQFYPENEEQINIITAAATKAGFFGGTVIDYPNSKKAKKFFLVLMTNGCTNTKNLQLHSRNSGHLASKRKFKKQKWLCLNDKRTWILRKKEKRLNHGKNTKHNSKYTGRRRQHKI